MDEISVIKTKGALLGVRLYPGVIVDGFVGQRYQIQAASDLNAPPMGIADQYFPHQFTRYFHRYGPKTAAGISA